MRKIINKSNPDEAPALSRLLGELEKESTVEAQGLCAPARPFLSALLFQRLQKPLAVICPTASEAAAFARDLTLFVDEDDILHYPPLDFFSIDMFALQREEELARLRTLTLLQVDSRKIIVTCFAACMQKVMPFSEFQHYLKIISTGDILLMEEFPARLSAGGYQRVSLVEERGEYSLRGNILDVFPPSEPEPLRLEMAGDEIESIRRFDCTTQRSGGKIDAFMLGPASEILIDETRRNLAIGNIKRRADDLDLSRDLRSRLTETLRQQSASSVNPIFLPLFYEDQGEPNIPEPQKLSSIFDYLPNNTRFWVNQPGLLKGSGNKPHLFIK